MTAHKPDKQEVAAWMESLGFFRSRGTAWMHNDIGGDITPQQATFFYQSQTTAINTAYEELLAGLAEIEAKLPHKAGEKIDLEFNTFDQIKKSSISIQANGKLVAINEIRQLIKSKIRKDGDSHDK